MINTKEKLHRITEVMVSKHKIWTIEGDRRGDVINCLSGALWITQEGDMRDYILEAGGSFWVTRPGEVIVQALDNSRFKYNLNEIENHLEPDTQPLRSNPR